MAKALVEMMSKTHHGLCVWHLHQNGVKHLDNLMKAGSHFLKEFNKCMNDFDIDVEFEEAWTKLIANYNVQENNGLK